jgi:hypothetical protein
VDPTLPITLEQAKLDTERNFAGITSGGESQSLVEAGLRLVVQRLKDS